MYKSNKLNYKSFQVIYKFITISKLRTITNYFIISLSLADLLVGCFSIPFLTFLTISGNIWPYSDNTCDAMYAVCLFTTKTSVFNLVLMTVDRYVSITRPLAVRVYRTKYNTIAIITAFWVVSFFCNFSFVLGRHKSESESAGYKLQYDQSVIVMTLILGYYLPVVVMCSFYGLIWRHLRHRRQITIRKNSQRSESEVKQKQTRTIAMIIVVFIATCLPRTLMITIYSVLGPEMFQTKLISSSIIWKMFQLTFGLQCFNSTVNPVCYALSNPVFRKTLKRTNSCTTSTSREVQENTSTQV